MIPRFNSIWRLFFVLAFFGWCSCSTRSDQELALIPFPQKIDFHQGEFLVDADLSLESELSAGETLDLQKRLEEEVGCAFSRSNDKIISLIKSEAAGSGDPEGYLLKILPHRIRIEAAALSGFQNAISTLAQIQKLSSGFPCLTIEDHPQFAWRGLMLDCSRTFIPVAELRKMIDALAFYKMNVLHLHLTDDQGWRLEIKGSPELTGICSQFHSRYANERGGYYSQEEMKELIEYARVRNVTIVPEIEMPGHSSEVFAAFPELSCLGQTTEIFPFFAGPGITDDIFCAGKEEVFLFLEQVLDEVCALFPSEYIHIGGDEAPKIRWDHCRDCQQRIQEEGLSDAHELQSYFMKRIEKMLEARGKKMIGWDEILEGGLADNAAVMSWRGNAGGVTAAQSGHSVVMSPTSHCYFDYSYGTTPTQKVYQFTVVPEELNETESQFVLGAQANFWSHIDRQSFAMERQIFPRLLALSERLWTGESRDYEDFDLRLQANYMLLDSLGLAYYHPDKIIRPNDSTDFAAKLNLEGYQFDFHGFKGADFNYQGMACKVVLPHKPAPGHPWIWRARFWGHEPQLDLALLDLGYHVVYCEVGDLYGNQVAVDRWNRFYTLMQKAGLAERGILEGMSRGGLIIYNWALANPDKVRAIYADAPVLNGSSWPGGFGAGKGSPADWARFKRAYQIESKADSMNFRGDPIHQTAAIARLGIPLIHVCGDADQVVPIAENTDLFEKQILKAGGKITVIRKPGVDHHPHSLKDPKVLVEFLVTHE